MTSINIAVSVTVAAKIPFTAFWVTWVPFQVGMRPNVDFRPGSPQKLAGVRIDPPPSLAVQKGTRPALTAALDPPLEPPGVCDSRHGFPVVPNAGLDV